MSPADRAALAALLHRYGAVSLEAEFHLLAQDASAPPTLPAAEVSDPPRYLDLSGSASACLGGRRAR